MFTRHCLEEDKVVVKQQHLKGSALRGGLEGGLQAGVVVRSLRAVEAGVRTAQLVPRQIVVGEPRHKLQAGSAAEWTTLRLSRTRSRIVQGICGIRGALAAP